MKNIINNDMSEYWNGVGGDKWVDLHKKTNEFLLPLGQKAMDVAAIVEGDLALDIGCGCGETSFDMANIVSATGHINGLDISRPIITEARVNKKQLGVKNVTFQCGDAQVFELDEGLYDLIYSRLGVMFFDDPVAAFINMRGALDKNGRLVFVCWQPVIENQWISKPLNIISKYIDLPEPTDFNAPGPFSFSEPSKVKDILTKAGFTKIEISAYNCPVNFGDNTVEAAHFLTQMGPAGNAISSAEPSPKILASISSEIEQAIAPYFTTKGIMLGAATWIVTAENSPA
jgi:ubiquinone/menaquinone biosynthesis C-methylase UbiE